MKKIYFTQRLMAYLIDAIIVYFVLLACTSVIGVLVPTSPKVEKATEDFANSYTELLEDPQNLDLDAYVNEQLPNMYIIERAAIPSLVIGMIINIAYFGAFQFMNNGQTFGKKLLKIRVVGNEKKNDYTYLSSVVRAAFNYGVFSSMMLCGLLLIFNAKSFYIPYILVSYGAYIFKIVVVIMVAFKKDGRGLPDLICHTKVENA